MTRPTPRVRRCTQHRTWGRGCPDCVAYDRFKRRRRSLRRALGQPTVGNLEQVTRHVQGLVTSGMTLQEISLKAGIAWHTAQSLYLGRAKRVYLSTANAVLQIKPALTPYASMVGIARRLQALAVAGFSTRRLAEEDPRLTAGSIVHWRGMNNSTGPRPWAHKLVSEVYERLWGYAGPNRVVARDAIVRGWHPPEAWDHTTIDDPDAEPYSHLRGMTEADYVDDVKVKRALAHQIRYEDLIFAEQVEMLRQYVETTGFQPRTFRETYQGSMVGFADVLKTLGIDQYGQPREKSQRDAS